MNANPETVLVTGAAGSVGHFLVEHLHDAGYKVVASDRPGTPLPKREKNISVRTADLADPAAAAKLTEGVNLVIHTAALIDIGMPFEKLEAVNVTATKALFEAAVKRGIRRFEFFSSGSTYKKVPSGTYREDMPQEAGNDYELSKILCEEYLRDRAGTAKTEVVVIRPSLIYGPRGKMLGAALACLAPVMHAYLPFKFGIQGGPRSNWVHAEDVARAALHLMEKGVPGEAYNVCDDDAIPFGNVVTVGVEAFGFTPAFQIPYPPLPVLAKVLPMVQQAGFAFVAINRVFGAAWSKICTKYGLERELAPKIDREALPYAYQNTIFVNDKLKATGFALKYPSIRDGFKPTIQWYQEHRWVPTY